MQTIIRQSSGFNNSGLTNLSNSKASSVNFITSEQPRVLVVDDHSPSRMTTVDLLSLEGYHVLESDNGQDAIHQVVESKPDVILLDIMMPQMDGFEICRYLKQDERTCNIPVIFITVVDDRQVRIDSMNAGGDDLLTKPLDRLELSSRVKSWIRQKRLNEDLDQIETVLLSIANAIENRYAYENRSSDRLSVLAERFGNYLKLPVREIQDLKYAAHLHDIGTVAIPDAVLLKKGELTSEERDLIRQHVLIGEQICQPLRNRRGILPIIRHHHERWDGSGYPDGLTGHDIPVLAQIFQILDIYDALTSERPYKQTFLPQQALEIINTETKKGWRNPEIVEKFTDFITSQEQN